MNETPSVAIVGAGPGDPDLLTLKALRLIEAAEVVVYDRLVSAAILDRVPKGATRIFAGKTARDHHMPQGDINALLVRLAESGRRVVRLKGGDPFVFGRGGEEALHLAENGIAFEIVPGITSSAGCAAYAGIPLTHRGLSKSVRFVTGNRQNNQELDLDWQDLADPETTLVIYMGRTNVRIIADQLAAAGLSPSTPSAVIYNGTLPDQRTLVTRLDGLADAVETTGLAAPTLLVIGKVVSLAGALDWFRPAADDDQEARG
jgi:uroporphyrin-III C-methyltransferase/precorrin-2 dehydrogenase/sirohydrochlorin ferrochelatase/uroporphyrin-III C-methyltransferase